MGTQHSTTASQLTVMTLLTTLLVLAGCSAKEPVAIGFIGGISGRVADLGIGGRNGAQLAIDLRNQSGGINGQQIKLLVEDDQQDPAMAKAAMTRLIALKPAAIIGPMTSAMAVAVVPQTNAAALLMISPTVTTPLLTGLDDHFMRVIAPATEYAQKSATYHTQNRGSRRMVAVVDQRNAAYTESWLADYRQTFEAAGGQVNATLNFSSSDETQFANLAERALQTQPDSVLILANSVDTAILAQQIRKRDAKVSLHAAEWAATERLIQLGGKAVDGMVIAQFLDRESTHPAYLAFRRAYRDRFAHEPGFAGLTGFDATNVVLDALTDKPPAQSLKQAILVRREFSGAQSPIRFDAHGDAARDTFITTIRNGAFVRLN